MHPAGPAAAQIAQLWWAMLVASAGIYAFVMILLAAAFRPRRAAGAPGARVWIHGLGLGFSSAVLAALLVWGLVVGERLLARPGPDVVRVAAEGRQWTWTFTYDDAPGHETTDRLHVPAGRPVDVAITSADVVHSFWAPRLAGKMDAIPGHTNVLRIEAWEPGEYAGVGAEFNGAGYAGHTFVVVAHDQAGWAAFLAEAAK